MANGRKRARCDCSRPATVRRNNEWICEFCARAEDRMGNNKAGAMKGGAAGRKNKTQPTVEIATT